MGRDKNRKIAKFAWINQSPYLCVSNAVNRIHPH